MSNGRAGDAAFPGVSADEGRDGGHFCAFGARSAGGGRDGWGTQPSNCFAVRCPFSRALQLAALTLLGVAAAVAVVVTGPRAMGAASAAASAATAASTFGLRPSWESAQVPKLILQPPPAIFVRKEGCPAPLQMRLADAYAEYYASTHWAPKNELFDAAVAVLARFAVAYYGMHEVRAGEEEAHSCGRVPGLETGTDIAAAEGGVPAAAAGVGKPQAASGQPFSIVALPLRALEAGDVLVDSLAPRSSPEAAEVPRAAAPAALPEAAAPPTPAAEAASADFDPRSTAGFVVDAPTLALQFFSLRAPLPFDPQLAAACETYLRAMTRAGSEFRANSRDLEAVERCRQALIAALAAADSGGGAGGGNGASGTNVLGDGPAKTEGLGESAGGAGSGAGGAPAGGGVASAAGAVAALPPLLRSAVSRRFVSSHETEFSRFFRDEQVTAGCPVDVRRGAALWSAAALPETAPRDAAERRKLLRELLKDSQIPLGMPAPGAPEASETPEQQGARALSAPETPSAAETSFSVHASPLAESFSAPRALLAPESSSTTEPFVSPGELPARSLAEGQNGGRIDPSPANAAAPSPAGAARQLAPARSAQLIFCFLIHGRLQNAGLWEAWFRQAEEAVAQSGDVPPFGLAVHYMPGSRPGRGGGGGAADLPPRFRAAQDPLPATCSWDSVPRCEARLLQFATERFPRGSAFLVLSDSALPVKPFAHIFRAVATADGRSHVPLMQYTAPLVTKHATWAVWSRRHARLLAQLPAHWTCKTWVKGKTLGARSAGPDEYLPLMALQHAAGYHEVAAEVNAGTPVPAGIFSREPRAAAPAAFAHTFVCWPKFAVLQFALTRRAAGPCARLGKYRWSRGHPATWTELRRAAFAADVVAQPNFWFARKFAETTRMEGGGSFAEWLAGALGLEGAGAGPGGSPGGS